MGGRSGRPRWEAEVGGRGSPRWEAEVGLSDQTDQIDQMCHKVLDFLFEILLM